MIPLFAILLAAAGVDTTEDFRAANERALEGDLQGAIALYETLIDRGVVDPDVLYNIGNAYAQNGQPIAAIIAYEEALRLAPSDEDILANVAFVRKTLGFEESDAQSLTVSDALEPLAGRFDPELAGWVGAVANALAFLFLYLRRRASRGRRILFIAVLSSFILASAAIGIVAAHLVIASDPRAVVTEEAHLLDGPHPKFPKKGPAIRGGRVRVIEEVEGYVRVLQADGTTGWLPAKVVTRV